MNRFRRLRGPNSYATELGVDPLSFLPHGGTWLDIGCGNAVAVREAAKQRPDIVIAAFDIEPGFVAPHTPPNLFLFQGDAGHLPLKGRRFDLVTATHVLHFIDDKQQAILDWFSVMKPAARLFANLDPHDVWQGVAWERAAPMPGEQTVLTAPVQWGTYIDSRDAEQVNRQGVRSRVSLYRRGEDIDNKTL